jgi:diguanylate cyclase (GGDEF)-like protein/PAS domain S-box-containing protein
MFRVLTCLTDEHDWRLVVLAGIVCFFTSLAAISMFERARATGGRARVIWLAVAGTATGCGIWATHFIAMLAYEPGVATTYDIGLTALSLVAAAIVTLAGLSVAVLGPPRAGAPIGGAIVGAGVACMHYTGMWALQVPGHVAWAPGLVLVSVLLGMAFGIAALVVGVRGDDFRATMLAAGLLTLAIISHHFTAMGAVEIIPDPARLIAGSALAPGSLSVAVAGATAAVLGMSLAGAWADHRVASHAVEVATRFHALAEVTTDAIAICQEGVIVDSNSSFDRLVGSAANELRGRSLATLFRDMDGDIRIGADPIEVTVKGPGGQLIACEASARTMPHHGRARTIVSLRDLRERKQAAARIHSLAHDPVTDLPNRASFNERLALVLERCAAAGEEFAVLRLDLHWLKDDRSGRPLDDAVVRDVSGRLRMAADPAFIARLGGNEYALIVPDGPQPSTADVLAGRLQAAAEQFASKGRRHKLALSIGIAIYSQDGADATSLLDNADAARHRAAAAGLGSIAFFQEEMDERVRERRALLHDLRTAVSRGELTLQYEPQVLSNGETVGFDALMSWQHPTRGMVAPDAFMGLAEEDGLVPAIGEWVLRAACREAASWPKPQQIAVNLWPGQFRVGDLPGLVHTILRETGLTPRRLELAIPEGVLVGNFSRAVRVLRRLKSVGVRFARVNYH